MSDVSKNCKVIFIGIAGPSGCGKSTYGRYLADYFHSPLQPITLDDFFIHKLTINHPILGQIKSLEEPRCLNIDGFYSLLNQIKRNPQIITPYHRKTSFQNNENKPLIIIIEGFLLYALSDQITNLIDIKIFLDSTIDVCRLRRYCRRSKIPEKEFNDNIIVSEKFQQWFDYLVWDEYLKRRDLQMAKADKIFHSDEYQQKQYQQLDNYIEQRLKQILE